MFIALAAVILCSCAKENLPIEPAPHPADGAAVSLTFGNTDSFSRAFFDNTATAEPWEKKINDMMVYAFDSEGKQVMRKLFSAQDIADMRTEFVVPSLTAGETVTFYVMANERSYYQFFTDEDDINARYDSDADSYNSSYFSNVSEGCRRTHGFAFTGKATATMKTDGTVNNVSIVLKRLVAKIAIEIEIDPTFTERHHGGTLRITSYNIISRAWFSSWYFNNYTYPTLNPNSNPLSVSQNPQEIDGRYCGLFYLYEQGAPSYGPEDNAKLTITANYDQDGNFDTIGDKITCRYQVELTGSGNGEIRRNGYYRISGTITDLDALHTRSGMEVSEWEVPSTQDMGDITISR